MVSEDEDVADDDEIGEVDTLLAHDRRIKSDALSCGYVKERGFLVGYHHNQLNVLPSHFVLPTMNPLKLITNWLVGDKNNNDPPPPTGPLIRKMLYISGGGKATYDAIVHGNGRTTCL